MVTPGSGRAAGEMLERAHELDRIGIDQVPRAALEMTAAGHLENLRNQRHVVTPRVANANAAGIARGLFFSGRSNAHAAAVASRVASASRSSPRLVDSSATGTPIWSQNAARSKKKRSLASVPPASPNTQKIAASALRPVAR